jgi:hypothetical protein
MTIYTKGRIDTQNQTQEWETGWTEISNNFFLSDPVVHISGGSDFLIYITGMFRCFNFLKNKASGRCYASGDNSSGRFLI